MNIITTVIRLAGSLALVWGVTACASTPAKENLFENYDFEYMVHSEKIKIVQVFDDGKSTFFQLSSDGAVPAVFADSGAGFSFTQMELYGPYIKVPFTAKRFLLKIGSSTARVAYVGDKVKDAGGKKAENVNPAAAVAQPDAKDLSLPNELVGGGWGRDQKVLTKHSTYSYSDRMRGDRVEWTSIPSPMSEKIIKFRFGTTTVAGITAKQFHGLAKEYANAVRVELIGYDDVSNKEGLAQQRVEAVTTALAASGIQRNLIKTRTAKSVMNGQEKGVVLGVSIIGYKANLYTPEAIVSATTNATAPVAQKAQASSIDHGSSQASEQTELGSKVGQGQAKKDLETDIQKKVVPEVVIWDLKKSDDDVKNVLTRWAKSSGYEVVFTDFPHIPVVGDASFESQDLMSAIDYVVKQSRVAGYVIPEPKAYSNNVVVFESRKEVVNGGK